MRKTGLGMILGMVLFICGSSLVMAEDMRAISVQVKEKKAALLEKAKSAAEQAEKEASESRNRIMADRASFAVAIEELKIQNNQIQAENERSQTQLEALVKNEKELMLRLSELDAVVRELVGTVRANARDLDDMLNQSQQSALIQNRGDFLKSVVNQTKFPGMDDIRKMVDLLFDEIRHSGEVRIENSTIVNRAGEESEASVLLLGNFTAAYQLPDETGFLVYSDQSRRFFALSRLPSSRIRNSIDRYMAGKAEAVPVDISRGAAVRQLAHRLSLWEQIPKGGPIVWPILFICLLAVLIIIERLVYLFRININAEKLMYRLHPLIAQKRWQECEALCIKDKKKPVPKVLLAGLCFRDMSREEMENSLQEAILGEVPRLERFLSTLGMLAAIAPLLGLLGTVTGMINTFHVITFYGAGDPRMMSGGISEALVTTMLGLTVAIPIMLCHTLLTRRIENVIGQMEEKAVALVNTIFKMRNGV